MKNIETLLTESLDESVRAKQEFWRASRESFFAVGRLLCDVVRQEKKVLIFGNGGSACDALHFSGEWVNRYSADRRPLPCIALTADSPLLTCISNDYAYEDVFDRQVRALGRRGDVAIGLTTSGNSKNVLKAFASAKAQGMATVALVGGQGGEVVAKSLADHVLNVAATVKTPRIQETHEWILHSLCQLVDHELFGV